MRGLLDRGQQDRRLGSGRLFNRGRLAGLRPRRMIFEPANRLLQFSQASLKILQRPKYISR